MRNKVIAGIILVIMVIPFKYAYVTPPDAGFWSLLNFLLVVLCLIIVSILLLTAKPKEKAE